MPLGGFGLLSLFYIFLGVRFLLQFIPRRKEIFDNIFTPYDRSMLGQAAFFVLLPLSVALHELGHAVCIWLMGGKVLGFGFYFLSGYVSYDPRGFSDVQRTLIAFAGTFVNLVLIVLACTVVFLKRPPLRAPWNELLLQFVFISGINALHLLSGHGRAPGHVWRLDADVPERCALAHRDHRGDPVRVHCRWLVGLAQSRRSGAHRQADRATGRSERAHRVRRGSATRAASPGRSENPDRQ